MQMATWCILSQQYSQFVWLTDTCFGVYVRPPDAVRGDPIDRLFLFERRDDGPLGGYVTKQVAEPAWPGWLYFEVRATADTIAWTDWHADVYAYVLEAEANADDDEASTAWQEVPYRWARPRSRRSAASSSNEAPPARAGPVPEQPLRRGDLFIAQAPGRCILRLFNDDDDYDPTCMQPIHSWASTGCPVDDYNRHQLIAQALAPLNCPGDLDDFAMTTAQGIAIIALLVPACDAIAAAVRAGRRDAVAACSSRA
jgi:hypothetical protein